MKNGNHVAGVAFAKARELAEQSEVVHLREAALDLGGHLRETPAIRIDDALTAVRKSLVDAYVANGAKVTLDYDGEAVAGRLSDDQEEDDIGGFSVRSEYFSQLTHREQAGYLYGLALGLTLGNRIRHD